MSHRRLLTLIPALLASLALAACSGGDGEIPAERADGLVEDLNALEADIDAGNCDEADATLTDLFEKVNDLEGEVDDEIIAGLREQLDQLQSLFESSDICGEEPTTTEETVTEGTTDTTTEEATDTTTEETTTDEEADDRGEDDRGGDDRGGDDRGGDDGGDDGDADGGPGGDIPAPPEDSGGGLGSG